jgi:putative ABC transport system permease protein
MEHVLARLVRRLVHVFRTRQREREMNDEMRFHIEMEARELARQGHGSEAAEREARLRFGGVERYKEESRDARGVRLVHDLAQDLRYAARQSVRNPSFTIAALLTLGLSVGAATFMYSFANMNPVPFDHSDRLVYVRQFSRTGCPSCQLVSTGNALALARSSRALETVAFVQGPSATALRGTTRSDVVRATAVTFEFFNILRVRPILGRTFLPSDTLPGAAPVAMISEPTWRVRFGADSSIIGRDVVLDGRHHTVRGIIGRDDVYPERTELWTVKTLAANEVNDHASDLNYLTIARLRDGATLDQAVAEAATVTRRLTREYPDDFRDWQLGVRPLRLYGRSSDADAKLFTVASSLLLVVACINLAGVLIARLTRRRRELAVRAAIGAAALRLTRQLLVETIVVCIPASAVAIATAVAFVRVLVDYVPEPVQPPGFTRLAVDWHAALFAVGVAAACGIVIALWPSVRFARPDLNHELREGARSKSARGASGGERLRGYLVVIELAVSVVLLAAAGLLLETQNNIARAPVGLSTDHVVTVSVQLPSEVDGKRVETRGYFDRLTGELARLPGVVSAGAVAFLPLGNTGWSSSMFQVQGHPTIEGTGGTRTQVATPGYFTTFRIPILRGRAFTTADADASRPVALVNETLVRRFFANEDPIGRVLVLANGDTLTVTGIVADVKQRGATADPGQEIIVPAATKERRSMTLVVRTAGAPTAMIPDVVRAIAAFDPNLAINRVRTMDTVRDEFLAAYRVGQTAMAVFAVIAIVIATMGLYGIISYGVVARTREFGVRLALGATDVSLLRLVVGQALRLAGIGVAAGIAAALGVMRLMQWRLYQVAPDDPATLAAVAAIMIAIAVTAALIPARRALAIDPVRSLRAE